MKHGAAGIVDVVVYVAPGNPSWRHICARNVLVILFFQKKKRLNGGNIPS